MQAEAKESPLSISTQSQVEESGSVNIILTLKNLSTKPLFHVQPMIHFHHSQSMMTKIYRLEPGQHITLENSEHPPVLRSGRYPLIVMASYKESSKAESSFSRIHTDSFFFREPVVSVIDGKIGASVTSGGSFLRVLLKNKSASLKNIRLMLLLPPGLIAEKFKGMMGLTMRGGEEKYFEVPVRRLEGSPEGNYPVHLTIEYGEMLKHYTGEVRGEIQFDPIWNSAKLLPHYSIMAVMALALLLYYRRKWIRSESF